MLTSPFAGMPSTRCEYLKKWLKIREKQRKTALFGAVHFGAGGRTRTVTMMLKNVDIAGIFKSVSKFISIYEFSEPESGISA